MPKILKKNTKAIQTRNRVRLYRGIKTIMKADEASMARFMRNVTPTFQRTDTIKKTLNESLRTWAIEHHIKRRALTALLKILVSVGFTSLPRDSRTLLKTPRIVEIENRAGGKYWHNGIGNCLRQIFAKLSSDLSIEINISIDGLPLFKSSPVVFWPFLFNIHGMLCASKYFLSIFVCVITLVQFKFFEGSPFIRPMVIGIWCGNKKPDDVNDYLIPLANDIHSIIRTGVVINGFHIGVSVRSFLCDGPARSMIKGYYN